MKWQNLIKVALKSILKNKMRTLLTMLGIIIGVAAVIVMVAIGQGAEQRIQNQISSLGTNLIMVFPSAARQGGISMGAGSGAQLTMQDVERLKKEGTQLQAISPVVRSGAQLIGGTGNWNSSCYGVSEEYLTIRQWGLSRGEFFGVNDVRSSNKVCVIGETVAKNLFPGDDPVGQPLRVRNVPFKIIGVLKERGQDSFGHDQDDIVIAPYTTVLVRLSGMAVRGIGQVLCSAQTLGQMPAAQAEIKSILRQSHRIPEGEDDNFTIRNQTDIAATAEETTRTMTLLLASIASISLLVGGIGIMNIMLVSVTERTREIGIRMAIGARGLDILLQFLIEAITLSFAGGLIGILLGFLVTFIVDKTTALTPIITASSVMISVCFASLVGIFFGFYPARKASTQNPIEALRYE